MICPCWSTARGEIDVIHFPQVCADVAGGQPPAYNAMIRSLNPSNRVWPLRTIRGLNVVAVAGHIQVDPADLGQQPFGVVPLRELPEPRPARSCFHSPGAP
jgi:hypothetical protein